MGSKLKVDPPRAGQPNISIDQMNAETKKRKRATGGQMDPVDDLRMEGHVSVQMDSVSIQTTPPKRTKVQPPDEQSDVEQRVPMMATVADQILECPLDDLSQEDLFALRTVKHGSEGLPVVIDLTEEDEPPPTISASHLVDNFLHSLINKQEQHHTQLGEQNDKSQQDDETEQINQVSSYEKLTLTMGVTLFFSEPFWTLWITQESLFYEFVDPLCRRIHLDYRKPIFSPDQFIKCVDHMLSQGLLQRSNVAHFLKALQPQTSIAFESQEQVTMFLQQVYEWIHVTQCFSLKQLTLRYIDNYRYWFSREQLSTASEHLLEPNSLTQDSGLVANSTPQESVLFTADQFTIYEPCEHKYEGSDTIALITQSLSMKLVHNFDQGTYLGQVNSQQVPDGEGQWKHNIEQSELYIGFWCQGKKSGEGYYQTNSFVFNGEWLHNEFEGYGTLRITSGDYQGSLYMGQFSHGQRHGLGMQYFVFKNQPDAIIMTDNNGKTFHAWYRGEWREDKRNGWGEFRDASTWRCGVWKNNDLYEGVEQLVENDHFGNLCYFTRQVSNYKSISQRSTLPTSFLRALASSEGIIQSMSFKQPKRTFYNYYCFRSRLECRWALFFQYLNIDYLYEPCTFELHNDSAYTPDFYLPLMDIWIEM